MRADSFTCVRTYVQCNNEGWKRCVWVTLEANIKQKGEKKMLVSVKIKRYKIAKMHCRSCR